MSNLRIIAEAKQDKMPLFCLVFAEGKGQNRTNQSTEIHHPQKCEINSKPTGYSCTL